jgi:hypothetical protein
MWRAVIIPAVNIADEMAPDPALHSGSVSASPRRASGQVLSMIKEDRRRQSAG